MKIKIVAAIIPGLVTNKDNQSVLSYGVMGGQFQPVGQVHIIQNIFEFNMSVQEAIDFPRAFTLNNKYKFAYDVKRGYGINGKKIYAIDAGYIERVRTSSSGYGKAIYLRLKNGDQALYAHLSDFPPSLKETVKSIQLFHKKYENIKTT